MCELVLCPDCGDRMLHLRNRGPHESSSAIGQYVHDVYPITFDAVDSDLTLSARSTRVLRHIEHKFPGQQISNSQRRVLPLIAEGITSLVARGRLHRESGVFLVIWEVEPETPAVVRRVHYDHLGPEHQLAPDYFEPFFTARLLA